MVVHGQKSTNLSHINKRRRRQSPHTPHLRREQRPRDAKPLPSIEESAKKGPFDPYAFVSQPPTPSLLSSSPNEITSPGDCRSDVGPHDAEPHLCPIRPQEQSFGHRQSIPVKREHSIAFTPVIKHPSLDDPLQTTQALQRKLEENDVVELDRDEYALQRFLKVQGELTELEAILLKGKKKHVFEQIKRNAATKSSRGVEEMLAENDATPTPSGRSTTLQEGTTGEMVVNEQHLEVVSKVVDMRTETSQPGLASTQYAPSTSVSGENKRDRPRKEYGSDYGAVHPSKRHVYDYSEGSQRREKSNAALPSKPLKRKELPGMGIEFKPRPNPPQDARKHQEKKLPRNSQRRQVDMPGVKNTVKKNNDTDIENTIDSAQNWLQQENALEQEARAKRWEADANWKDLTTEQADAMRRQGSIPPAKFYGHPPKWRPPPEWRLPPEEKEVMNAVGHEDYSQRSMRDDRAAVESRVKPAGDTVEASKMKSPIKKRKRDTKVSKTAVPASTMKNVSPDLPSMKELLEGSQIAVTSPRAKKKSKYSSGREAVEDVVNDAKEQGSQMADTPCPAQRKKSNNSSCTEAVEDIVNDARELSTPSKSKKRKKAKEPMEVHEVAGDEMPTKTKKRKKSKHTQDLDEAVVEEPRPETLVDRLKKMKKKKEKALALQEATNERSQPTIPTPEAAKPRKLDRAPPIAPEPVVEDVWQPIIDDDNPISPPRPSPSSKKKQRSKHNRPANSPPATAVDDNTPETIETPLPASPSNQTTHSSFNHLRRRHQSLPPRLTPNTTIVPPNAKSNTTLPHPQPPPIIPPHPNLYDLNLLAIRTRLSNLEAAVAANPSPPAVAANPAPPAPPAPAPAPNTLTRYAALKLRLPTLPRAVPPGTTRLSDAELIEIGKKINHYERHRGAPYAFSWRGRLYADYDYLLGRAGWDFKEKARVKNS